MFLHLAAGSNVVYIFFFKKEKLGGLLLKLYSYILHCDHAIWKDGLPLINSALILKLKHCCRPGMKLD